MENLWCQAFLKIKGEERDERENKDGGNKDEKNMKEDVKKISKPTHPSWRTCLDISWASRRSTRP